MVVVGVPDGGDVEAVVVCDVDDGVCSPTRSLLPGMGTTGFKEGKYNISSLFLSKLSLISPPGRIGFSRGPNHPLWGVFFGHFPCEGGATPPEEP